MRKVLLAVILWAVAFGFVEAAVVEYLRALYCPPEMGGFQFPLKNVEELANMGEAHLRRLFIELGRELATLIMLAAVGLMAGRNRREGWAYFLIAFGIWDIFYYLWLRLFLGWPPSLMTWDLLFLFPVPWVSPVLAPVMVAGVMIAAGLTILSYEALHHPLVPSWKEWALIIAGGLIIIVSFCWDAANIMNQGMPNPFHWPLFCAGLGLGMATFTILVIRAERSRRKVFKAAPSRPPIP